jgi:hypothetical protein
VKTQKPAVTPKTVKKPDSHQTGATKKANKAKKTGAEGKDKGEKHPGGRPTVYRPDFCAKVIKAGEAGKSYTQIAVMLGVTRETLYAWRDEKPEFSDALTRARQSAQAWWEDVGQAGLEKQGFQSSMWAKNMTCRFPDDWRDNSRTEITGKDGEPIKIQKIERVIVDPKR